MGSGQRLGQKTGVNWQREMPGVKAETHIESRPQTKRPQGLSTCKGGRGFLGRPFSPILSSIWALENEIRNSLERPFGSVGGHHRCTMLVVWLEKNLAECTSACVCVYLCVCVPTTPHRTSSTTKKEKTPPFQTLWHVHAPPSSRWVSVCLFHAKLLTRLTEIPLSLPPVPSAACCFSFYCWIYAPSSVISFGLTQIFGSCHLAPICWTNKPNARHDSRPNSGSRSIVNNFLLPDSSSSHCSICVAGYSQLISIFKKMCGIFMEFLSMANK